MAEQIAFENGPDFQLWRAPDNYLHLGSGYTAYHHTSLIDLYLHANFTEIQETFCGRMYVRTYVRTDIRTDGHSRLTLLGRRVDLKIVKSRLSLIHQFLPARRYSSAGIRCRHVSLSLSQAGSVSKQLNVGSRKQRHVIAQRLCSH